MLQAARALGDSIPPHRTEHSGADSGSEDCVITARPWRAVGESVRVAVFLWGWDVVEGGTPDTPAATSPTGRTACPDRRADVLTATDPATRVHQRPNKRVR